MKRKILFSTALVILIVGIGYCLIFQLNSLSHVGSFLFVTDKNKMNWIGLTGIIAIAGLIYNFYDGRRRFRGDIRSKSRIDWMKTVRALVAQYISDCDNIVYHMEHTEGKNFLVGDIDGAGTRIKKTYNEILLYVPDNESNKLLLDNIKQMYEFLKSGHTKSRKTTSDFHKIMRKTVDDSSMYFKIEWEKAKRGE